MYSSAEKTTKPAHVARKAATEGSFFGKTSENGFFGAKETSSFFGGIQTKLTVSKPDDPYEKEADKVADQVMRMPETVAAPTANEEEKLQRKENEEEVIQPKIEAPHITAIQCKEEEGEIQTRLMRKDDPASSTGDGAFASGDSNHEIDIYPKLYGAPVIQRSGRDPPGRSPPFEQNLSSSKGGGSALPSVTRQFMESRFQADFSGVRIHTGTHAETMSSNIHAQAFTHGNDIYFNSGKYSPHTADGSLLLAHELTHTIQQGASKTRASDANTISRKPIIQRAAQDRPVPAQLNNAVAKAKAEEGKVNASKAGPDGNREGWERLLEYFKTTLGEDKVVPAGAAGSQGAVSEDDIKKKREIEGMPPAHPARGASEGPYIRDAMPSWCGIFAFWALHKGGVPMKKWELGGRVVTPDAAYPPGYIPKAGDIAYRNNFSHFALVEKASGGTVTTINGNTAGEDNLGAQVQSRDHPLSDWTAFFDPLLLKDGELRSGEGVVEEKPKTLRELRRELFNVQRKPEGEQEEDIQNDSGEKVQAKPELSSWHVNTDGAIQRSTTPPAGEEEHLQAKEEDQKEIEGSIKDPGIQKKDLQCYRSADGHGYENGFVTEEYQSNISDDPSAGNIATSSQAVHRQEDEGETDRGPPVQLKADSPLIQCGWFDDAISFVNDAIDYAAEGLEAGKRMILNEARDFVMAIPGYRALRVVLGEDPITGEEIERNGHNFIEAAFDIMPGGRLLHEKLTELGALDEAAAWIDDQIATLEGIVDAVITSVETFWNSISLSDLASPTQIFERAGNIIHNTITSIVDFAVTAATELLETVKRFLLTQIVNFVKNHTTAYPLLTVILGQDPITEEAVERNGTNILNALLELGGEEGREQRKQMQETGTFQKVADWIDRGIAVFSSAYEQIRAAFSNLWSLVTIENLMNPVDTFTQIYDQFATPIRQVWDFVSETAAIILRFIKEVLMRRLSEWARTVRGYHLVTVIIGKDPFTDERVPRTVENVIRGFMSLMDGGEEQFNQLKESGAIDRTTQRIMAAVRRLNMTPASIVQLFIDLWNSFSLQDLADPVAAFRRILNKFGEPIGRLIAFVVEIVKIVIEVILQVMNFPTDLIANIITKAMQAFDRIKRDPVGFLKNLLRAIKQGFIQFFDNIVTHLMNGLVGWLTAELRDAGVPALEDLSLRGVISWVLQVLGISMEKIWEKLAAHPRIGPERVARIRGMIGRLEGIWTFIRDVQERGIVAIWEKIQEQLSNLWDTILDAVKNWIMERIVTQVVTRLLSMLDPTGIMAVINSAIAIYRAVQSFIRYLRQMLEVVNSFVEGVAEIASGNIATAANFLERTMGRAMPIVIGFLANQVGLSGIGRRVGEMIGRAREMVDEALTWLVNRAVNMGMNLIDRALAMGRSAAGAVMGWLGIRRPVTMANGETHTLYLEERGGRGRLMIASTPKTYVEFVNTFNATTPDLVTQKNTALGLAGQIDTAVSGRDRHNATDATAVSNLINQLAPITRNFTVNNDVPPSVIEYGGVNADGGALYANARILSKNHVEGSTPQDSAPIWANANRRRPASSFIRGHLLNHNIGGPGHSYNLTPITGNGAGLGAGYANRMHLETVEREVKSKIDANKVLRYRVSAMYRRHPDRIFQNTLRQRIGTPQEQPQDQLKLNIMNYEQDHLCVALSTNWAILKKDASGNWVDDEPQTPIFIRNQLPDGDFSVV